MRQRSVHNIYQTIQNDNSKQNQKLNGSESIGNTTPQIIIVDKIINLSSCSKQNKSKQLFLACIDNFTPLYTASWQLHFKIQ